mgnify:FL=1
MRRASYRVQFQIEEQKIQSSFLCLERKLKSGVKTSRFLEWVGYVRILGGMNPIVRGGLLEQSDGKDEVMAMDVT